jgi:hypothetical protein
MKINTYSSCSSPGAQLKAMKVSINRFTEIYFSYETLIALRYQGKTLITIEKFSHTTSCHKSSVPHPRIRVPQELLEALTERIISKTKLEEAFKCSNIQSMNT